MMDCTVIETRLYPSETGESTALARLFGKKILLKFASHQNSEHILHKDYVHIS
jgi:hypothetical protein